MSDESPLYYRIGKLAYNRIEEAAKDRWCSKKKGEYGGGIANRWSDPYRIERIGLFGEWAFNTSVDEKTDLSYIDGGDKHDGKFYDSWDVKTQTRETDYEVIVQYSDSRNGKLYYYPIDKKYYVFAQLVKEDREAKTAIIKMIGYVIGSEIAQLATIRPGKKNYVKNYYIRMEDLRPIRELIEIIRTAKDLPMIPEKYRYFNDVDWFKLHYKIEGR